MKIHLIAEKNRTLYKESSRVRSLILIPCDMNHTLKDTPALDWLSLEIGRTSPPRSSSSHANVPSQRAHVELYTHKHGAQIISSSPALVVCTSRLAVRSPQTRAMRATTILFALIILHCLFAAMPGAAAGGGDRGGVGMAPRAHRKLSRSTTAGSVATTQLLDAAAGEAGENGGAGVGASLKKQTPSRSNPKQN
ncbi:hypothetical protein ACP70R_035587 [Stipagrostis hirtigluma subsp. patula]